MKRTRIFVCSIAFVLPVLLAACSDSKNAAETSGDPDEAFLADVRRSSGAQPATGDDPGSKGMPKIELQTTHYDMGVVPGNEIAVQSMKVYNRGTASLTINRVQTSCGCTNGEMEQSTIPPNGEARLIIHVDPKKIPGFQTTKVLTLHTNDPLNPHISVDVTTTVAPEMEVEPDVVDFGSIARGEGFKQTIRIRQLQDAPLEITGAAFQRDFPFVSSKFAAVPEAEWRTPGKREYTVEVQISPDAPAGDVNEWFIISSNVERMPQFSMRVRGAIVGPYAFTPATVTVRGAQIASPVENVLSLTGREAITILEVVNSNPAVEVTHRATGDPKAVAFDLTIPKPSASITLRDTWRIVFEVGGVREEQQVPVVIVLAREN